MVLKTLESMQQPLQSLFQITGLYIQRCQRDQVGMISGYLAYISLLSLVPLVAVAFSVLNAFPMFSSLRKYINFYARLLCMKAILYKI